MRFHSPRGSSCLPFATFALRKPALPASMRKTPHKAFSKDAVLLCECSHAAARSSRNASTCHQYRHPVSMSLTLILVYNKWWAQQGGHVKDHRLYRFVMQGQERGLVA